MVHMKLLYIFILSFCGSILGETETAEANSASEALTGEYKSENCPLLSIAEECARVCQVGEPPKTCYYQFTLEVYTVLGGACQLCTPNNTNPLTNDCQCVLADGVERGGILTANRMIPGPSIQVCEDDQVVIDVKNAMQGLEVSIHWHGIWQRETQYYDGAPFVTQCPIPQGTTFRYKWKANAGTHFWHAHTGLQKFDGLLGSIIVRQPLLSDPNSYMYDYDLTTHVIVLSDWMREMSFESYPGKMLVKPGRNPDNFLINGKGYSEDSETNSFTNSSVEIFSVAPWGRYRFRLINALSSVCPVELTIESHTVSMIASDGIPIQPVTTDTIVSQSGERYDFIINTNQPAGAYWMQVRGLNGCEKLKTQQHAILRYESDSYGLEYLAPESPKPEYDTGLSRGVVFQPFNTICNEDLPDIICLDQLKALPYSDFSNEHLQKDTDIKIYLPFNHYFYEPEELFKSHTYNRFIVTDDGKNYASSTVDDISFIYPSFPPLSQIDDISPEQFCNGDNRPPNCGKNCMCTHKIDIPLHATVEIVLVDEAHIEHLDHSFHLHGYHFNVISIGTPTNPEAKFNMSHVMDLDNKGQISRQLNSPLVKDTIGVPNGGYVILRFKADNPGYWLFHCHLLPHSLTGMILMFHVGTQSDLPPIPPNFPTCGNYLPPI